MTGLKKSLPEIESTAAEMPIDTYDRIILCAPIWCEDVCPIARAFLKNNSDSFCGEIYYVITHMSGISYKEKIDRLYNYSEKKASGFISVQTKNHDCSDEVADFCKKLI